MNDSFLYLNKKPLITIGITCFNARLTIKRALLSAINQTWKNKEILIVNDCSDDNSIEIINNLIINQKNIKLINNKKNLGCSNARNIIIDKAKGEFIAFFDDDDFSRDDRLILQYKKIVSYEAIFKKKLVACYASGKRIYPNGYIKYFDSVACDNSSIIGEMMSDFLLFNKKSKHHFYGNGTPTCSLMARRDLFYRVGLFDDKLSRQEDIDFAIRLGFKGGHFIGIPDRVLYQYYSEGKDKTQLKELNNNLLILNKNSKYLKEKKLYRYMILWSKLKYFYLTKEYLKSIQFFIFLLISNPIKTILNFFGSGLKRIIHDIKISR